ncbi:general secretion pathway protein GspB [Massilia sp. GCM10020059]|uniref:General secretion pathway protein GspB n=1 Tax=Massilia agrisoli TaxID=2892444 RepID=A0ABS8IS60_9BURK|nr:general secretion pathway protein GspB [Massilia agrisoli]MCC6070099.1 general secretion pathway protein GspB [Massilia agrisoli]
MSYILEALKKAQAERELGSAPTIHAAPVHAAPVRAAASRKPLLVGLGAGALIAGVAAFAVLRQSAPPPPQPQPMVVATAPAPQQPVVAAPPAPPVAEAPPAPKPPVAAAKPSEPKPQPRPERAEAPARPDPAPVAAVAPAPVEDSAPPLGQLPEAIQREVPQIAVGGYIYSANPADRLLLIDKVLRREGEEVAPGLVLERLLPKAAVMNYRGYRYRLPY